MEQARRIELPSQPWQGRIRATKLRSHLEGPVGFEPTIKELQSTALPLGYDPRANKVKIFMCINQTHLEL